MFVNVTDSDWCDTELEVDYRKGIFILEMFDQNFVMNNIIMYTTCQKCWDVRSYGKLHHCHDLGSNLRN